MTSTFNHEPNQQRDITYPIPPHIEASDDNSSVFNLSIPTQLPTRLPNKVDEFLKWFQIQSTQQDGGSLSSFEQTISSKNAQHQKLKDKEIKIPHHNVHHREPHKHRRDGSPTSSNQSIQDNIEQYKPHPKLIHLRLNNQINYNEDSSSNTTIPNIKQDNK